MVGGKEHEGEIDGGRADLHSNGVRKIACGSFRIGLARERGRELKHGRRGRACRMSHHGMNLLPVGRRWIRPLGPFALAGLSPASYSSATSRNGSRRVGPGDSV